MTELESPTGRFVLRSPQNEADMERYATFNAVFNNPYEGANCACLLHHHPETTNEDYWMVEDSATGETVSTTCLLPWRCHFSGLELRVAQLEMVLTHPDYRHQGLVRRQIQNFEHAVQERGYDLSIIWGIPYYYRQYGYAYAIDGDVNEALPVWKIPPLRENTVSRIKLRPAGAADVSFLEKAYLKACAPLDFYIQRSAAQWQYMLGPACQPVKIVEHPQNGESLGYIILAHMPAGLSLLESGLSNTADCLAVLGVLKEQANQQILLYWPQQNAMAGLVRSLGSQVANRDQWLIRIPDLPRFLYKISPLLEKRLAAAWQDFSGALVINLYRQAYRLRFVQGKLNGIDALGFVDASMGADGGDLLIPPEAFVRLILGYRGLEELGDAWPDTRVKPGARSLVETLFPRLVSYLYAPYYYMGEIQK